MARGAIILGILGLALVGLLGYALSSPVWYDDAGHFLVSKAWADTGVMGYPGTWVDGKAVAADPASPFITLGPTIAGPGMWVLRLWDGQMLALRLMMVLFSLLAIWKFFFLAERVTSTAKAGVAALLVVGNIQFLAYGSQFLGEVPMLAGLFAGWYFVYRGLSAVSRPWDLWASIPFFCWAFVTKESALIPIGLGVIVSLGFFLWWKQWPIAKRIFLLGSVLLVAFMGWQWLKWGNWHSFSAAWEVRGSYADEFWAWGWEYSLPYLLKKPVIWLGAIALVIKVRIRKENGDRLLLGFFLGQLLWFLASAGYDRFGFQLLFIPAIYLSEFVVFGWKGIGQKAQVPVWQKVLLVIGVGAISWQFSVPTLFQRLGSSHAANAGEHAVAAFVADHPEHTYFTFDQQVIPFLDQGSLFLNTTVPSNGAQCRLPAALPRPFYYIEGEYGRTEFSACRPGGEMVFEAGEYVVFINY